MSWDSDWHTPVLAHEVRELLGRAGHVLDGTLGGGGHTLALLEQGARVTATDRDPGAIRAASERLRQMIDAGRVSLVHGSFAEVDTLFPHDQTFDGVLLDLGVSSRQLDDDSRGFSFRPGVPLDMRMDTNREMTAADWLNRSALEELSSVFREHADERRAARLARTIVERRSRALLMTSDDLVGAIRAALGPRTGPSDFARLFQAVRIAVNDEHDSLVRALELLRHRLNRSGRLVVITYHSGEDRVVKHAFADWSRGCICPTQQPFCTCDRRGQAPGTLLTRRSVVASDEEKARNPRARSARLRAWQRAA
ncbi:MAG: 16S rRNA (cytosine(1402)-N(4))-methyltransferase RsmH [Gemmatimonadota bacterium]